MNVKEIKSENLTYEEVESMDKEYYLNCFVQGCQWYLTTGKALYCMILKKTCLIF